MVFPVFRRRSKPQGKAGWEDVLLWIGSVGPIGNLPASGTASVLLVGIPLYFVLERLSLPAYLAIVALVLAVAVVLHQIGDRLLGEKDSGRLVWDEVAGFLVAISGVPFTWQTCLVAVLVERFLDIAKIPPADWIERKLPGGWGVVGDDVVAGAYTCALLHLILWKAPSLLGVAAGA